MLTAPYRLANSAPGALCSNWARIGPALTTGVSLHWKVEVDHSSETDLKCCEQNKYSDNFNR